MICDKSNPSPEDDIDLVDGEGNDEEMDLRNNGDEMEEKLVTSSYEWTMTEDEELNNILRTTIEKANQFMSENNCSFMTSLDAVFADMTPADRRRAENEILVKFVKLEPEDEFDYLIIKHNHFYID